ncbi:TetR/AcrR family transcriptional regulator [Microbacterium sp. 3H14]|nr:TetR/AcrR family transcriptional regulator [Microbacterium sp. 3H14]
MYAGCMMRGAVTADIATVRDSIRASSDPRVAATQTRLSDAVRSLALAGRAITVSSLVAEARVSRATFYTHFSGIDDLALHLQEQAFRDIAAETRAHGISASTDDSAMARSQRALIEHYATYRALYAAAFSVAVPRGAESRVAELMKVEILAHIREITSPPPGIDPDIAATYIAHAATGLIASWVLDDLTARPDEIAEHLTQLMPRWMISGQPTSAGDTDGPRRKKNQQ